MVIAPAQYACCENRIKLMLFRRFVARVRTEMIHATHARLAAHVPRRVRDGRYRLPPDQTEEPMPIAKRCAEPDSNTRSRDARPLDRVSPGGRRRARTNGNRLPRAWRIMVTAAH